MDGFGKTFSTLAQWETFPNLNKKYNQSKRFPMKIAISIAFETDGFGKTFSTLTQWETSPNL